MKEQTKLKRQNKYMQVMLRAVNQQVLTNLNDAGRIYSTLHNTYMLMPVIGVYDLKWLAPIALRAAQFTNTLKCPLPLPTYNEGEPYTGNLPITELIFSDISERHRRIQVSHIGAFDIVVNGPDQQSKLEDQLEQLSNIIYHYRRKNPHMPPKTDHTLDGITTKSLYIASTQSLAFPELHPYADTVLHIEY